jgi:phosphoglycerol transferase MdoB-like AlkP superfamily enzyme
MRERLIYLGKVYVITIVVFVIAKVVFMVANYEGHAFGVGDVWDVVRHGIGLDLSTGLYVVAVPFLVTMVSVWWPSRVLETVMKVYYGVIAIAMMLAFTADTSLYPFWGFKLDASCLQYLETPAEAKASVSGGYMAVRFVVIVAGAWVLYRMYEGVRREGVEGVRREGVRREGRYNVAGKARSTVFYFLCIPLMVIGIRGGLDESTTNIGQVYFSQDQFLNHSAVNPVFSFFASLESTSSDNVVYDFYDQKELKQLTEGLYDNGSVAGDTLLKTQRPNVVVILLESCGSMFLKVMPNLRKAAQEGVEFTNCYGNSYRTDRGTVCALSGYLSFPTMSVMKMSNKVSHLPSIARSLQKEGYHTAYLYGGDINFTKMKGYLISTGFEKLHWKQDYTEKEQSTSKWGVRDDITFETLEKMVKEADQRFLIGYSTLSSHEPWDVPEDKFKTPQYNGFWYVDQCIGRFLKAMKQSAQWDNLLIVFMPDHSSDFEAYNEQHPDRNRIPMVWTGGAVKGPRKLDMICNQSDFAATLLGQMGISHRDFVFSRDVTSESYRYPFAIHMFNNGVSMTDSTGFMLYDLTADKITVSTSKEGDRMARTGKAILQMAAEDLRNLGTKEVIKN